MNDKRDFLEETLLNAAEYVLLKEVAAEIGLSKSSVLRHCLLEVWHKVIQRKRARESGLAPEE
jgi:transcriptional antiterminator